MEIELTEIDFRNATDEEYAAFNKCRNQIQAEILPDDPPIPLKETVQGLKNIPNYIILHHWIACKNLDEIVAFGDVNYSMEDNLHLADFEINVLPAYRRSGLGKAFLSRILQVVKQANRTLLITVTNGRVPAGEAFMKRIGAKKGMEGHTNQLIITDLNTHLVQQWIERAKERAGDFEIGLWEGEYPDADIAAIVKLYDLLNQQPFGELDIEEFSFSAERIRQNEISLFARGYERWTLYVREIESGKFAGYTDVFWNPNRPELIYQGMTGVFPEYRNKGLGRWLKAEMLKRILAKRPQAKIIRTGNADSNAPMLKINNELGFKPYFSDCVWQVETEKVAEYLANVM